MESRGRRDPGDHDRTATDHAALPAHVYTKAQKKRLERRFKDPKDPLNIVIVRDMWLSGFDAPCCHTMYVDNSGWEPQLVAFGGNNVATTILNRQIWNTITEAAP